jgi:hypothetical protein
LKDEETCQIEEQFNSGGGRATNFYTTNDIVATFKD